MQRHGFWYREMEMWLFSVKLIVEVSPVSVFSVTPSDFCHFSLQYFVNENVSPAQPSAGQFEGYLTIWPSEEQVREAVGISHTVHICTWTFFVVKTLQDAQAPRISILYRTMTPTWGSSLHRWVSSKMVFTALPAFISTTWWTLKREHIRAEYNQSGIIQLSS